MRDDTPAAEGLEDDVLGFLASDPWGRPLLEAIATNPSDRRVVW
jgi:hypothetical protein